jgi:sRNA-binding regulator protein Hfq
MALAKMGKPTFIEQLVALEDFKVHISLKNGASAQGDLKVYDDYVTVGPGETTMVLIEQIATVSRS